MKTRFGLLISRFAVLLFAILIIAGCKGGGGGGSSGPSLAPEIFDLVIRVLDPEVINQTIRYIVAANFWDAQGDVINGQCEVLLNNVSLGRVTIDPAPGTDPNITEGIVACGFFVRATVPQTVNGRFRIFDRAGNQSNELTFALGIRAAQVPKGQVPQGEAPRGSFEGRMEWGRVSR